MIAALGNPVYDTITTPLIASKGRVLSGCSTNACIVCAQLKVKALLVGCVGEDFKGQTDRILSYFGAQPILYPSKETGGFSLLYDSQGNRELEVLGMADPITTLPDEVFSAEMILLGPILQEIDSSLLSILAERDKPLFCDPQGFLREVQHGKVTHVFPPFLKEALPTFAILKPNEPEAFVMTGKHAGEQPREVAETLFSYGSRTCIVTLAEKGSLIYNGSELLEIPAYTTDARDPTGAGDTYAAGFMVEYLRSGNLYEAGMFASATASLWVEGIGPYIRITEGKVKERVEALKAL